mgnify:FL=1
MVKIAIPNFCINFLNKTVKSLSILRDFAVAPFMVRGLKLINKNVKVEKYRRTLYGAWIKITIACHSLINLHCRIPRGCVD